MLIYHPARLGRGLRPSLAGPGVSLDPADGEALTPTVQATLTPDQSPKIGGFPTAITAVASASFQTVQHRFAVGHNLERSDRPAQRMQAGPQLSAVGRGAAIRAGAVYRVCHPALAVALNRGPPCPSGADRARVNHAAIGTDQSCESLVSRLEVVPKLVVDGLGNRWCRDGVSVFSSPARGLPSIPAVFVSFPSLMWQVLEDIRSL